MENTIDQLESQRHHTPAGASNNNIAPNVHSGVLWLSPRLLGPWLCGGHNYSRAESTHRRQSFVSKWTLLHEEALTQDLRSGRTEACDGRDRMCAFTWARAHADTHCHTLPPSLLLVHQPLAEFNYSTHTHTHTHTHTDTHTCFASVKIGLQLQFRAHIIRMNNNATIHNRQTKDNRKCSFVVYTWDNVTSIYFLFMYREM